MFGTGTCNRISDYCENFFFFLNLFDLFFPLSSMVFELSLNEEKRRGFFCCKIYLRKQVWEHIQRVPKDALFTGVKDGVQIIVWFLPECYRSANPSEDQSFTSAGKIVWDHLRKMQGCGSHAQATIPRAIRVWIQELRYNSSNYLAFWWNPNLSQTFHIRFDSVLWSTQALSDMISTRRLSRGQCYTNATVTSLMTVAQDQSAYCKTFGRFWWRTEEAT